MEKVVGGMHIEPMNIWLSGKCRGHFLGFDLTENFSHLRLDAI
jgi:hypothetical protein